MKRTILILGLAAVLGSSLMAQPNMGMPGKGGPKLGKEKREMMMMFRLTEELDLTTKQGEKFFPRYREHRESLNAIRKEIKAVGEPMKAKLDNKDDIDKGDIKKAVNRINELKKKQADIESEFILKMEDILSPEQQVKLAFFKHKMVKDIKKEMKGRRSGMGNMRRHKNKNRW